MRLIHILIMFSLLLLIGCGGGGGGATATDDFTAPDSLTLAADYPTLAKGTATYTTTVGHYIDSADQDLTASVVLSSSDTMVANPVGGGSLIVAGEPGTAVITATWTGTNGNQVSKNLTINVTDATVSSIAVSVTPNLPVGATRSLVATGTFSDSSVQELIYNVAWSSGDTAVATVGSSSGVVAGVGVATDEVKDTSIITANFGGQSGGTLLTVVPELVFSSDPSHLVLDVDGSTAQLSVTRTNADGSTTDETANAVITYVNPVSGGIPALLFTENTGLVEGLLSVGAVEFTATLDGVVLTYELAVISGTP